VLIVDGTLVPTRNHKIAGQPENCRYPTNHQVAVDAGYPPGCRCRPPSAGQPRRPQGVDRLRRRSSRQDTAIADGGYQGTGLVILDRRPAGGELRECKKQHNPTHAEHPQVYKTAIADNP
jgi:hypothetical protein